MSNAVIPIKDRDRAALVLSQIAWLNAQYAQTASLLDRKILKLKEKYQPSLDSFRAQIDQHRAQLETWLRDNRADLLEPGVKTLKVSSGKLWLRDRPRGLAYRHDWDEDKTLAKLLSLEKENPTCQWAEYIRREPSIDKRKLLTDTDDGGRPGGSRLPEAMLAEIGLKIVQEESFGLEPRADLAVEEPPML